MKGTVLPLLIGALVLTACASLAPTPAPFDDVVATRVSQILTAAPTATATATEAPILTPTETAAAPPTGTPAPAQPTETPQLIPTATSTVTSTRTPPPGDPRLHLGNPTWRDTFKDGANWLLGKDAFTQAEIDNGRLVLTGLSATDGWRLTWPKAQDYYLEMTVKTAACSSADQYGLFVRVPADRSKPHTGYMYTVTCGGRYALRKWDGNKMTWLIPWSAASTILSGPDQTNRIGVLVTGERMVLYANGVQLAEVHDDSYVFEGRFGIFISAKETPGFTIFVDEIAYWVNP